MQRMEDRFYYPFPPFSPKFIAIFSPKGIQAELAEIFSKMPCFAFMNTSENGYKFHPTWGKICCWY